MSKLQNPSNMGADSQLVACSLEKDLVIRIDELARREQVTRSTWMREAIIAAYHAAAPVKRTPLHGYKVMRPKLQKSKSPKLAA